MGNEPVTAWQGCYPGHGRTQASYLQVLAPASLNLLHSKHLSSGLEVGAHVHLHLVRRSINVHYIAILLEELEL